MVSFRETFLLAWGSIATVRALGPSNWKSLSPPPSDSTTGVARQLVSGLTALVNLGTPPALTTRRPPRSSALAPRALLRGIRADFEEREYLWSGQITEDLYDDDCSFSDPTLSFEGGAPMVALLFFFFPESCFLSFFFHSKLHYNQNFKI